MDEYIDGGIIDESIDEWIYVWMKTYMDGCMDGCIYRWMDECMNA